MAGLHGECRAKIVCAAILGAFLSFTERRLENTLRFIGFVILLVVLSAGSIWFHRYASKPSE
jgi:hypothetical protein